MDSILILFGNQLKKIRKEKLLSQEELADLSGLHRTYISSVELGQRNISLVNIQRLADSLEIDISDFFNN